MREDRPEQRANRRKNQDALEQAERNRFEIRMRIGLNDRIEVPENRNAIGQSVRHVRRPDFDQAERR